MLSPSTSNLLLSCAAILGALLFWAETETVKSKLRLSHLAPSILSTSASLRTPPWLDRVPLAEALGRVSTLATDELAGGFAETVFEPQLSLELPPCVQEGFEYRLDASLMRPDGVPLTPEETRPHFVGARLAGKRFAARVPVLKSDDGTTLIVLLRIPYAEGAEEGFFAGDAELQMYALEGRYTGVARQRSTRLHSFASLKTRVASSCNRLDTIVSAGLPGARRVSLRGLGASRRCSRTAGDFSADAWDGYWARSTCPGPFCGGAGRHSAASQGEPEQEANAGPIAFWIYRTWVCFFDVFSVSDAQQCLAGKKWVFSMDSNGPHSIHSLLVPILNATEMPLDSRGFRHIAEYTHNATFTAPREGSFCIVLTYNGHANLDSWHDGLSTVFSPVFVERHSAAVASFNRAAVQLTVINSGLHDLAGKFEPADFAAILPEALDVYDRISSTAAKPGHGPTLRVWRTTITPAGVVRTRAGTPQTVEILNAITAQVVRARKDPEWLIVDDFDMTFPWSFDNRFSDGGHYGVPGSANFVDQMLLHVYLTLVC